MKNQKGFTLIELMIVVAIIGILATIGVPQFQKFQARARQSEARTSLSGIYMAMKSFHAEWNKYYGDFRAIGFSVDGRMLYDAGFANSGNGILEHPVSTYRNSTDQSRIRRVCGGGFSAGSCEMITPANGTTCDATGTVDMAGGFLANASGMVNTNANNTVCDQWTIDQNKQINNSVDGLNI